MITEDYLDSLALQIAVWNNSASTQWSDEGREFVIIDAEILIDQFKRLLSEIQELLAALKPWNGTDGFIGENEDLKYAFTTLETNEFGTLVLARLRCTLSSRSEEANPPWEEARSYVEAKQKAIAAYDARWALRNEQQWVQTLDLHVLGDSE